MSVRFPSPGRLGALAAVLSLGAATAVAQQATSNKANWALSDKFNLTGVAANGVTNNSSAVTPRWIGETDSLWYDWRDRNGRRFMLVVPKTKTKQLLFDHKKFAAALSVEIRKPLDPARLDSVTNISFSKDRKSLRFNVQGDTTCFFWSMAGETIARQAKRADCQDSTAIGAGGRQGGGGGGGGGQGRAGGPGGGAPPDFRNFSPDSTHFAFARDHQLFVVNVATKDTVQLTRDGARDYSFGFLDTTTTRIQQDTSDINDQGGGGQQTNTSRDPRRRANVTWAPDSKSFYVQRTDNRKVKDLFLVNSLAEDRPALVPYKYSMPGEVDVAQQELHAWQVGDKTLAKLPIDRWKDQRILNTHFTSNGSKVRVIRRDRLQRNMELVEVDLATKKVTSLITESVQDANLENQGMRYVSERPGPKGTREGDIIWWSERTGWGHYYVYDHNGKYKYPLTSGTWRAAGLVNIDSVRKSAYITGVGREDGENPYYRHLYRVNLDGTGITLLDAGDATHTVSAASISPTKQYIVDNYSRIDQPGKSVLRDATGKVVMELEAQDVSRLQEMGWKAPERFTVKAADGVTDLYGNIFKPYDFDPAKKYPIIAHVYPGPQTEGVTYTFSANGVPQRLAQLGFIVIQMGNRGGSPDRSNAYQSFSYYNMRDYGLADKKAGIEQLAARHSWIDIDRVGIYGHSGGGFMTAAALMLPPYNDFFKVGVSSSGNHDNNVYNQNWSEQYNGLREVITRPNTTIANNTVSQQGRAGGNGNGNGGGNNGRGGGAGRGGAGAGGSANALRGANGSRIVPVNDSVRYEIRVATNAELAANLKGNLLLVHGDMDNNVHPAGTIRLADALIKAQKRFDLMILPGQAHGYQGAANIYFTQRLMEYFAEHLLGDYYGNGANMSRK